MDEYDFIKLRMVAQSWRSTVNCKMQTSRADEYSGWMNMQTSRAVREAPALPGHRGGCGFFPHHGPPEGSHQPKYARKMGRAEPPAQELPQMCRHLLNYEASCGGWQVGSLRPQGPLSASSLGRIPCDNLGAGPWVAELGSSSSVPGPLATGLLSAGSVSGPTHFV